MNNLFIWVQAIVNIISLIVSISALVDAKKVEKRIDNLNKKINES